jgi:hypothetical protein
MPTDKSAAILLFQSGMVVAKQVLRVALRRRIIHDRRADMANNQGSGKSSGSSGSAGKGGSRSAGSSSSNDKSSSTRGGTSEQHAAAGRQSHKNDDKNEGRK